MSTTQFSVTTMHRSKVFLEELLLITFLILFLILNPFQTGVLATLFPVGSILFFVGILAVALHPRSYERPLVLLKRFLLIGLVVLLVGLTAGTFLSLRAANPEARVDYHYVHDDPVQMEEAVKMLLRGKNPYQETFEDTALAQYGKRDGSESPNPALWHFIKLPFHLLFSVPFSLASTALFNWYDERILYVMLFAASLVLLWRLPPDEQTRNIVLIVGGLNPFLVNSVIYGTNDIFVFFWVLLSLALLQKKRVAWSSLALAAAVASKHFAWFAVPFYFAFLLYRERKELPWSVRMRNVFQKTWPFFAVTVALLAPFLLWNAPAFLEDVFSFPLGAPENPYPISGLGLSPILVRLGILNPDAGLATFLLLLIVVTIPIMILLLHWQRRSNTVPYIAAASVLLLLTVLLASRFFNVNYFNYLFLLLLASYVIGTRENDHPKTP